METETPAEPIVVDEAENQSFLAFKFGALINSEKKVWIFSNCGRRFDHGLLVGIQGKWRPPGQCRLCNQYNSAPGCLVCNKALEIC